MVRNGKLPSEITGNERSSLFKDTFLIPTLCGGQVEHLVASSGFVDKLLLRQISQNETVRDIILRMNASELAEELDQVVEHVRAYNFDDLQNALTRRREAYLSSDARRMLEETAARLDQDC